MDLFRASGPKADPAKISELKAWVYEAFEIEDDVPVSISQLACHEPDCPPVETVIAIMTSPPQQYKLHRPITEITQSDIQFLNQ